MVNFVWGKQSSRMLGVIHEINYTNIDDYVQMKQLCEEEAPLGNIIIIIKVE